MATANLPLESTVVESIYALGRPIGYADHLTVDQIIAHAAKHEYRLQEIIQATVASSFFQTK